MIKNRRAGTGIGVFIIILLILLGIGAYVIIQSGALGKVVDPCERELQDCNHRCGEGILSSICKEKCSYDYRRCKS